MKLAYSPASPYVRKVTAYAIKRGIDKRLVGVVEVQIAQCAADSDLADRVEIAE